MDINIDEIRDNLAEYREQLAQVEELLTMEPDNAEYVAIKDQLLEALTMTEEVLREAESATADTSADAAPKRRNRFADLMSEPSPSATDPDAAPSAPKPSASLPAHVANQIREAQIKAALTGSAPAAWAVGAACKAMFAEDSEWYEAEVTGVAADGKLIVRFTEYGNMQECTLAEVRLPDNEVAYQPVSAPKRVKVAENPIIEEIPKWAEIKPEDNEKERKRKMKIIKQYKKKIRFQKLDNAQVEKQSNWQSFLKGKTSKKSASKGKVKKKSMFSAPEGNVGKVGVVGSGKGKTQYMKPKRHEFEDDEEGGV